MEILNTVESQKRLTWSYLSIWSRWWEQPETALRKLVNEVT